VVINLKILHTGDIHLGAKFSILGEKGEEQRLQILKTFGNVIDLAIEENVDLFLIAGDLFDSNNPSRRTLDGVVQLFKKLEQKNIPICLIPGTHDRYDAASIYRHYNFNDVLPNFTLFTGEVTFKVFENLGLTVYGKALTTGILEESPLEGIHPQTGTKFHIALIHGSMKISEKVKEDGAIFTLEEVESSGMNYIAMGHWHSFADYSRGRTKACYCGSPEALDIHQKGSGNVLLVFIDPDGSVKVEPRRVGRRLFKMLELPVDMMSSVDEINEAIKAHSDPDLIIEVKLQGLASFDLEIDPQELEQELEPFFFRLRVIDESHPKLEEISVEDLPENMIIGKFIRIMEERLEQSTAEERRVIEEALKLGVALLKGENVLR